MARQEVFEILVQVKGEEEAKRLMAGVGDSVQQAGTQAGGAAQPIGQLGDVLAQLSPGAAKLATGLGVLTAAFDVLKRLASEYWQELQRTIEAQNKVAENATKLAEQARKLAGQTGQTEGEAAIEIAELAKAGGLGIADAKVFAEEFDKSTAQQGGLPKNRETAREISAFVGAQGLSGADSAALLDLLENAGALGSAGDAKSAIAKVAAAAKASGSGVGELSGLVNRSGARFLEAGVGLDEVLGVVGQALSKDELGAPSTIAQFERLATGGDQKFNVDITRRARAQGIDPRELTGAQRFDLTRQLLAEADTQAEQNKLATKLGLGPGDARAVQAFGGEDPAIASAIAGASVSGVDALVAQARTGIAFQKNVSEAEQQIRELTSGEGVAVLAQAREVGRREFERRRATGEIGALNSAVTFEEVFTDEQALAELQRRRESLRGRGADVSEVDETLRLAGDKERWGLGPQDQDLERAARAVSAAERGIRVNITNVGTQYNDVEPGRVPPDDIGFEASGD